MSAANGGNGQAPTHAAASAGGNGQAPTTAPANNDATPSGAPHGQAPTAIDPAQQFSADDAKRIRQELDEARRDAAKYRDELKKRDDAGLSEQQKRERDFADLQAKNFEYEARLQSQALQLAGYKLGSQLGIGDISAALALVQVEHQAEVKYAADGTPENLSDLLKAVLKEHPGLAAGAQATQRAPLPASSGGATNPGTIARPGATFTREQIARMSPREYEQNRPAIMESLKAGTLRP